MKTKVALRDVVADLVGETPCVEFAALEWAVDVVEAAADFKVSVQVYELLAEDEYGDREQGMEFHRMQSQRKRLFDLLNQGRPWRVRA